MDEWRKIKTYDTRPEAEIDRQLLEDAGIPVIIQADDAGGMYPGTIFLRGVHLFVKDTDAYKANGLLSIGEPEIDEPEIDEPDADND